MDELKTVLLKSRVGPCQFTIHDPPWAPGLSMTVEFSIDRDCRERVPVHWWEQQKEEYMDRVTGLKYKEAFLEL